MTLGAPSLARVGSGPHGLEPLMRPTVLGPSPWAGRAPDEWRAYGDLTDAQRTAAAFAEQFALDVSTIGSTLILRLK